MIQRKLAAVLTAALLAVTAQVATAQIAVPAAGLHNSKAVHHGGGCRKDSPPGQCCHAGSEPYHCH
jgi:Spy/CpxP family protein refolding chaperone